MIESHSPLREHVLQQNAATSPSNSNRPLLKGYENNGGAHKIPGAIGAVICDDSTFPACNRRNVTALLLSHAIPPPPAINLNVLYTIF